MERGLLGHRTKVFYNDGNSVTLRIGIITEIDDNFIVIENTVFIPRARVVRVEIVA